jgi:hypothetical protein
VVSEAMTREVRIVAYVYKKSAELHVRAGRFGRGSALHIIRSRALVPEHIYQAAVWCYANDCVIYLDNSAALVLPDMPSIENVELV